MPNYSKKKPPPEIAEHVKDEEFEKSQDYGRDKAYFSFVTAIFKQTLESAMLHFGLYAYCWKLAGDLIAKFGFSSEYQVRRSAF